MTLLFGILAAEELKFLGAEIVGKTGEERGEHRGEHISKGGLRYVIHTESGRIPNELQKRCGGVEASHACVVFIEPRSGVEDVEQKARCGGEKTDVKTCQGI